MRRRWWQQRGCKKVHGRRSLHPYEYKEMLKCHFSRMKIEHAKPPLFMLMHLVLVRFGSTLSLHECAAAIVEERVLFVKFKITHVSYKSHSNMRRVHQIPTAHCEHLVAAPKVVAHRMDPRSIAASPCHRRNRAGECFSRCATRGACLCVTALEHDMCARLFWLMWIKRCVDSCVWWTLFISPSRSKFHNNEIE